MKDVGRVIALVVVALALLVAALAGWRHYELRKAADALPVNTRLGGDFVLPSTRGEPLDSKALRGKVVLLNFGFTSCPDVCPTVLARLKQVLKELGPDAAGTQVVFVSFDPARDPIDHLGKYLAHFDPAIIGATGTDDEVAAVTKQYGAVYMKRDSGSAAGYAFAHSDYIYLIDTEGRVRKLYDTKTPTPDISADVRTLLAARRSFF
ncbi:MAG: SCO family protein [Moraxellaceae bacterium]|nr:SCO family protein [Moraxellaceae bacterium]